MQKRIVKKTIQKTTKKLLVKWFPEDSQATKIVNYAYSISSWDMDFIYTIWAENWSFDMYKRSHKKGKNWYYDYWLCQINQWRHKEIVNNKEFWESYRYQIDKCFELYKWWTKFYGYNVRYKVKNRFYWTN